MATASLHEVKIRPRKVRLEASTVCQLRCPACPTASGEVGRGLGKRALEFAAFKRFVDQNPGVSAIELSNWGEIFLNKDLPRILEYAFKKHVALSAANGANLNHLDESAARAVVRYRLRVITCSIDGASAESYPVYRVQGDFQRVMNNIKTINRYKARYRSPFPRLHWQFVAFGHNEHEIGAARSMARELGMNFSVKLSWEDLYTEGFSTVVDGDLIRRETELDVASRAEFREKHGREYLRDVCCSTLWSEPQINHDGRVLGCPVNYWGDYGNAFAEGLENVLNGERMNYARAMLMGRVPDRSDVPCTRCKFFQSMKATANWIKDHEIRWVRAHGRWSVGLQNLLSRTPLTWRLYQSMQSTIGGHGQRGQVGISRRLRVLPRKAAGKLVRVLRHRRPPRLRSGVHSLSGPMEHDKGQGWKSTGFFFGRTRDIGQFSCHFSQLEPGASPHLPHRHREEEILLLLTGEVQLSLPDVPRGSETYQMRLKAGQFVYYPAFFAHTLKTVSAEPARYLMFKWQDRNRREGALLEHGCFDVARMLRDRVWEEGFRPEVVVEGPTECLVRLQAHTSTLSPGAGYAPHVDPYDVAIVLFKGEVETLGEKAGPGSLILYAAGDPHGIRNLGDTRAEYVVFEFQGQPQLLRRALKKGMGALKQRIRRAIR